MTSARRRKSGTSIGWRLYVATWTLLGVTAATYLATAVSWADLAERYGAPGTALQQQSNEAQRAQARMAQSVKSLEVENSALADKVNDLNSKLTAARTELAGMRADLAEAKAAAEARVASARPSETAPPTTAAPSAGAAAGGSAAPIVTTINGSAAAAPATSTPEAEPSDNGLIPVVQPSNMPPLPPRVPQAERSRIASAPLIKADANQPPLRGADIATGSVASRIPAPAAKPADRAPSTATSENVAFGPATVAPARADPASDPIALRLSNAPSISSLKLSWRVLRERHGSLLGGLRPRFRTVAGGATGVTYQLVAGPVASRSEADQVCTILRAQNVRCAIDAFAGDPL